MSIINRDAVKGAVVTTGTGVVLKKARGFLRNALGLNKKTDNGGIAPPQVIGKRTTKNFTFPLDVEVDQEQVTKVITLCFLLMNK